MEEPYLGTALESFLSSPPFELSPLGTGEQAAPVSSDFFQFPVMTSLHRQIVKGLIRIVDGVLFFAMASVAHMIPRDGT